MIEHNLLASLVTDTNPLDFDDFDDELDAEDDSADNDIRFTPLSEYAFHWPRELWTMCEACKVVFKDDPPAICVRCLGPTVHAPILCQCIPRCDGVSRSNYNNNGCRCDLARAAQRAHDANRIR